MTDMVGNSSDLVRHGVAWLGYKFDYVLAPQRQLLASRLYPIVFWNCVLKGELDDFVVTYQLCEQGILRIFVSSEDGYPADDASAIDGVNYGYYGDFRITNASALELLEGGAQMVLSHAKAWAQEQLRLSKAAAVSASA